ncbi:MAG: phage tail protein [Acidobacteriota bacterium]
MPQTQKRSYTAGHFELQIDGAVTTAYLKSVDGGFVHANPIHEPIGPDIHQIKHSSTVQIEPFTIDFGISGANSVLKWIQASWRKDYSRKNGQITHADFDLYKTFEHEFFDALITETKFPTLDGASKEAAYIQIKLQPEHVITKPVKGDARVQAPVGAKQKMWMCNGFRFNIDGLDEMKYTNKIESFSIKQSVKPFYTGHDRFPQIEPTKIEFPNIVGTISLEYADRLHDWYNKAIHDGQADLKAQKTGSLEFLSPDRKSTIFRINMYEIGIHKFQIVQSHANASEIKRARFELFVGRMDLDGAGMLGME